LIGDGGPAPAPRTPLSRVFETSARKVHLAGTHRTRSPAETLAAYTKWMPHMGITRLANVTGLDHIGMPVYAAIRPNARSLATSQGKGLDADSAKASALMEAIELWHAENIEGASLSWDSYLGRKRKARVLDVERVHLRRGRRFGVHAPRLWIEGFDLIQREPVWVPFEMVSMNYVEPGVAGALLSSSNGLASGNHPLEALCHGLCEVIERHSEPLWTEGHGTRIDLASIRDPAPRAVLDLVERSGARTALWEITSAVGVPVYLAVVTDPPDAGRWRLLGGYDGHGCHLSPSVAVCRAVTEAVQSRLTFIAGNRDDCFRPDYWNTQNELLHRAQWEEFFVSAPPGSAWDGASLETDTFEGDLALLLSRVQQLGLDRVIAVDLTRPEIGIPVVKVVVPGLRQEEAH
jgi:ribosomal protein S12 methylthiotransferase accessory factor